MQLCRHGYKTGQHSNTISAAYIHSTQQNNLLVTSYWSMFLYRTMEKMENVALLTSVLSHQLQSHIAKSHQPRLCTQQSLRIEKKTNKYASEYKEQSNTHFEPFVIESGGAFVECAKNVFSKICNIIIQQMGQRRSDIKYLWKSKLLVILAKIRHGNALKCALAHNIPHDPSSGIKDLTGCYENENIKYIRRVCYSGVLNFLSNKAIYSAIY